MKMRTNSSTRWCATAVVASLLLVMQAPSCANGGIGGSGTITNFGSIFVNGVEWFTDTTTFVLDGVPGTEADLQLGMVVGFEGTIDASGTTGVVARVTFDDDIEGPVTGIVSETPTLKTLTILGQSVSIQDGLTIFDVTDPTFNFGSLMGGDVVEVSGYVDGNGKILASWVRRLGAFVAGETHVELEGSVADLEGGVFLIGPVFIVITASTDLTALPGGLSNGTPVEVEGIAMSPLLVVASSLAKPEGLPTGVAELSLEGIVTDFVGVESFRVGGQQVDATSAAFEPAGIPFLADGVLVEVEGPVIGGVLVADEVELEQQGFAIAAPLTAAANISAGADLVGLLGVAVKVGPATEFIDERDELPEFALADVSPGDFLHVEGLPTTDAEFVASSVTRTESKEISVLGPVDEFDFDSSRLSVAGVLIRTDQSTKLKDEAGEEISSLEFFSELWISRSVEAVDLQFDAVGDEWIANEISLAE